jgi:hypothetical protein
VPPVEPGTSCETFVPLGTASSFVVLAATTITSDGETFLNGNIGVYPGTAITGFQPVPYNTIDGPGTVTPGLGIVVGTIYPGGPVAEQAQVDASNAYNFLVSQVPNIIYSGVTQLDGLTFTPGVYNFAPSANLMVNGKVYLDFQGNNDAVFIFQMGSTLVTMAGSQVIALNNNDATCTGTNVFWSVGSSATIDGDQFIGTVIATTTITMTYGANVVGRMLALNGAVTMISDTISSCCTSGGSGGGDDSIVPELCRDFTTGGGWILTDSNKKATFGVSGGIKNENFWGQLSYVDHSSKKGLKVKSTSVTSYLVIDEVTRQIMGKAKINGKGSFNYTVVVVDNGEPGVNDSFSIELSNGYYASGTLEGGNIQLHKKCGESDDHHDGEKYDDKDERDGNKNYDNDRDDDDDDDYRKDNHKSNKSYNHSR